jgi:ferritin
MSEDIVEALNRQLNQELRNAYLYFAMAAYFKGLTLNGFANFFMVQAREELEHAVKIYDYITKRGWSVKLFEVVAEKTTWSSVEEAVRDFYEAEKRNTQRIWDLVELAKRNGDKATEAFLQWFVNEQVEEEEVAADLRTKVELVKGNIAALLALDNILAQRK